MHKYRKQDMPQHGSAHWRAAAAAAAGEAAAAAATAAAAVFRSTGKL